MKALLISILIIQQVVIMLLVFYMKKQTGELNTFKYKHADCRRYIEMLIETVYTHKHDPKHLLEHLCEEMTVKKLLCYHIVAEDLDRLFPPDFNANKNDMLIYKLSEEGFSVKELCLLFGLNNLNTVYVKCSRIKKKLYPDKESQERT